ncbi:hypothetical protein GCM10011374_11670 [Kocuria dechangensis]|uniref:Uncharacterized protein n=1 Tax=Kocuria dechangensis TaxID=1176249 RepID=A0A917GLF0_9MICC|nr:hypothetical protein GCM10011374_11670 [Kocuria dechangensis]
MARRVVREVVGPAVPRWVVEYQPGRFVDQGDWVVAVWDWVEANLSAEHRSAAYDLMEASFQAWMGAGRGA